MDKVNLGEKLRRFTDRWSPRIVGELNGQHVKVAKLEPAGTRNTGNVIDDRTAADPERI